MMSGTSNDICCETSSYANEGMWWNRGKVKPTNTQCLSPLPPSSCLGTSTSRSRSRSPQQYVLLVPRIRNGIERGQKLRVPHE